MVKEALKTLTGKQNVYLIDNFKNALFLASNKMSISTSEWLSHGNISNMMRQKTMYDFF